MKTFLSINGNHGGSFYFSLNSFRDWGESLGFYRGVTLFGKAKKFGLFLGYPLLKFCGNLSCEGVKEAIEQELGVSVSFDLNDSAMVSPTRDKVIIHRHGVGYEKIAVGKSLAGVRTELLVYQLLRSEKPEFFQYSELLECESKGHFVRFLMGYAKGHFSDSVPELSALLEPLAEFFSFTRRTMNWQTLWRRLLASEPELEKVVSEEMREGTTPVGLVHRDFKPWNVKSGDEPLFFDFESASFQGCPLEDFFNYTLDPMIRFQPISEVKKCVVSLRPLGEELLKMQEIPVTDFDRYWKWYVLERVAFWRKQNQRDLADRFLKLYE